MGSRITELCLGSGPDLVIDKIAIRLIPVASSGCRVVLRLPAGQPVGDTVARFPDR